MPLHFMCVSCQHCTNSYDRKSLGIVLNWYFICGNFQCTSK
uniref:Uncharacterized protein n=1 Tax=Rhizophora mucronata TaxID=61149 RepID=A0A2P2N1G1_RHIMU